MLTRLVASMGVLLLVALTTLAQDHTKDSLDTVKKSLADKKAVLFDVREKVEWDKDHLKDAKLLPLSILQDDSRPPKDLPKDKAIYLHCASGVRCVKAAEILKKQGYDARPLKQGYAALVKEGFA